MDAIEFSQMVDRIRDSLEYTLVGLSLREVEVLNQRLDSDAYKAAMAVTQFFEEKRNETI